MTIDLMLLVNHDIAHRTRPNRALNFLTGHGYRVHVISGVDYRPKTRQEIHAWGIIHYFRRLKPFRVSWLTPLVQFASTEGAKPSSGAAGKHRRRRFSMIKRFIKSLLYVSKLVNFFFITLYLIIRFSTYPAAKLYYADDFDMGLATLLLAQLNRRPFIYDAHELFADQLAAYPGWYRRVLIFLEQLWIQRACCVTTVGETIAGIMEERFQMDRPPLVIRSCPAYQQVTVDTQSALPLRILYHGLYSANRGLEQAILAMQEVSGARLYLRGYGPAELALHRLVADTQMDDRVTFLPPVPMAELLQSAVGFEIGIGPFAGDSLNSRYCLPNKVFEYMMAGLALAVSDLPEVSRLVKEHEVGVTFDPHNPSDIARAINDLLAEPQKLRTMRQNALRAARDVFNYEQEGEKLLQIVRAQIGDPNSAGR